MKKLNFKLTWPKVIIFAIIAGVYTGITALIPAFRDTSFQDISISFEWWILFGILIILGSRSSKDAALKCFIFFLISQPLVYLVQIIVGGAGWDIFSFYRYWFIWTLLTLPMGYIGYLLKKDKWWGLFIMLPIWLLLGGHVNNFMGETFNFFPNHLLSLIFCIVTMYGYIFIFKHKRERWLGALICTIIIATCLVLNLGQTKSYNTLILCSDDEIYFDNDYIVEMDESYGTLQIIEKDFGDSKAHCLEGNFKKLGKTEVTLKNTEYQYTFDLTLGRNTYSLDKRP